MSEKVFTYLYNVFQSNYFRFYTLSFNNIFIAVLIKANPLLIMSVQLKDIKEFIVKVGKTEIPKQLVCLFVDIHSFEKYKSCVYVW